MRALVVGGGLAGTEAAFQLAERGVEVTLVEQKPTRRTPAQTTDDLAELVCSNSLRGAALTSAVGLLKEELRRAGSLILRAADETRVPAGGALAVDRARFGARVTELVVSHPRITLVSRELTRVPDERPTILATGPLTGDALAAELARLLGAEHLAYYDAISPIVSAEGLDWDRVWKGSRYGKGDAPGDDEAYVNCPLDEPEYRAFVEALLAAEKVAPRAFEEVRYFEGCLPIEVMAARGPDTLSFGPMKPVGLVDPRTGRRPFAVVQLRPEDAHGAAYNLVGFQTRMTYGEQARVLRTIPGLAEVEFLRFGSVHRNTFVNAPEVLDEDLGVRGHEGLFLAGQITGVEGYVESAASGLLVGVALARRLVGLPRAPVPSTTAMGSLLAHLRGTEAPFQPSNVTWAHTPPLAGRRLPKRERYEAFARRALEDLSGWVATIRG